MGVLAHIVEMAARDGGTSMWEEGGPATLSVIKQHF